MFIVADHEFSKWSTPRIRSISCGGRGGWRCTVFERGTEEAIWRRVKLAPFEVTIAEADRDEHLGEKLQAEDAGILNWMIEGCLRWRQREGSLTASGWVGWLFAYAKPIVPAKAVAHGLRWT